MSWGLWGLDDEQQVRHAYVVKANEKLHAPWSVQPAPGTLYRGLALRLPPELREQIAPLLGDQADGDETYGQHLKIGPMLLKHLQQTRGGAEQPVAGLGTFWSTDRKVAEDAIRATQSFNQEPGLMPVMMTADWDGTGLDYDGMNAGPHNWLGSKEQVLRPGTPLQIKNLHIGVPQAPDGRWYEVLNPGDDDADYRGMGPGPQHHTASTDGVRYAHIIEADVAEDLRKLAMPPRRIPPMKFDADLFNKQMRQLGYWSDDEIAGKPDRANLIRCQGGSCTNTAGERAVMMSFVHHDERGAPTGILHYFPEGSRGAKEKPGGIQVLVHPDHQGKGIGSRLLDEAMAQYGPEGSDRPNHWAPIDLEEQQTTPSGYGLYEKHRRDHPTAARLAMPSRDAYDYMIMDRKKKTDDIPEEGSFYHGSNHEHQPGDILESVRARGDQDRIDYYENSIGAPNHADWVWMYNHPAPATKYHKNVYELEPLDEGPWVWNNILRDDGQFRPTENDEDFPRLVSPRARIVRKLSPDEHAAAGQHLSDYYQKLREQRTARLAMAWDQWAPQIEGGCEHGCDHSRGMMGQYSIAHPDGTGPKPGDLLPGLKGRSVLHFTHDTDQHGTPELYISGVHTDENHRRDGVAESLLRRMVDDHPGVRVNPGYMTDMGEGLKDGLAQRVPGVKDVLGRLAAVTQDLVDRLDRQFHGWWTDTFADRHRAGAPEVKSWLDHGDHDAGPTSHWPNIEAFLKERYPAAHKGHEMGLEEAGHILDGRTPMPYQQHGTADLTPYATGPDAETTHGYDPREIAAGMLLLHNRSHPLRGDMAQEDQDRLTDIFDKRQQMQRAYERRNARLAMPQIKEMIPADRNWLDEGSPFKEYDDVPATPVDYTQHDDSISGDWYHVAPQSLKPGTKLVPGGGPGLHDTAPSEWESDSGFGNRRNHVWLAPNIDKALFWQSQFGEGARIHHVKPGAKPQPWNMTGSEGFVAPHAHVIEDVTDWAESLPPWPPHTAARLAMAWDEWAPQIQGGCRDGCALHAEGRYVIPQAGAFMDYIHRAPGGTPTLHVLSIYTHPEDRGSGAAEAMIRRLMEDHPGVHINPGTMTNDGQKFHDRMLDKEPDARSMVVSSLVRRDGEDDVVDCPSCHTESLADDYGHGGHCPVCGQFNADYVEHRRGAL